MSGPWVLDSYAVLAFLENEPGADRVGALLKRAAAEDAPLFLSLMNWGEVYYILLRATGERAAQAALDALETLPISVVAPNRETTLLAATLKAGRKMSYADCFAAALAKLKRAALVTGDKEFKAVEGIVRVEWV